MDAASNWRFLEAADHDADHNTGLPLTIVDGNNETVAEVYSSDDATVAITRVEAVANAHAIAAARDMLAALKTLCEDNRISLSYDECKAAWDAARAAIQRAEGRS